MGIGSLGQAASEPRVDFGDLIHSNNTNTSRKVLDTSVHDFKAKVKSKVYKQLSNKKSKKSSVVGSNNY